MKLRLIRLRDALADSFWFVPSVLAVLAVVASVLTVELDRRLGPGWMRQAGFVWSGGAEGARAVLSVIAGSIMTVVSIVFSITISTIAQTSSHYGPRVLRNFTSDRGVQFTLGIFIATFVYCLLVLRTVRSVQEGSFVPYLSVTLGIGLALASFGVLIFFIHHIAQNIQTENLVATVGGEVQRSLGVLFPEEIGKAGPPGAPIAPEKWDGAHEIAAASSGYVQRVDETAFLKLASAHDLQLKLERRPGDFVSSGGLLLRAQPADRVEPHIEAQLRECVALGPRRTPYQDPRYALQQLVEIAAHALSPGINEPFTALDCLDWIGGALRGVASREIPSALRCEADGRLRVVARPVTFEELAAAGFDPIRLYGANSPEILEGLLRAIGEIRPALRRADDRACLIAHVDRIEEDAACIVNREDRHRVIEAAGRRRRELAAATVQA